MKVWEVGVSDCKSSHTICICATKEIALREMFAKRDALIAWWKEEVIRNEKRNRERGSYDDIWKEMIDALSSEDYENWDNYPHEVPWIRETEIVEA
jgi:hypothetical protein